MHGFFFSHILNIFFLINNAPIPISTTPIIQPDNKIMNNTFPLILISVLQSDRFILLIAIALSLLRIYSRKSLAKTNHITDIIVLIPALISP